VNTNQNITSEKSFEFAITIVQAYKYLLKEKKEFVLSKQLLRSGTSIGANIHEALSAESKNDFVHKLSLSLKEAQETEYWLRLLQRSQYLEIDKFDSCLNQLTEIIKLLKSSILTTKQRYNLK
jgi:four helix bundle protein